MTGIVKVIWPDDLAKAEFDESKHPRAKDGEFTDKGGGGGGGAAPAPDGGPMPSSAPSADAGPKYDPGAFWEDKGAKKLVDAYPGPHDDAEAAFSMADGMGLKGKARYDYAAGLMRVSLARGSDRDKFDHAMTAVRIAELRERKKAGVFEPGKKIVRPAAAAAPVAAPAPKAPTAAPKPATAAPATPTPFITPTPAPAAAPAPVAAPDALMPVYKKAHEEMRDFINMHGHLTGGDMMALKTAADDKERYGILLNVGKRLAKDDPYRAEFDALATRHRIRLLRAKKAAGGDVAPAVAKPVAVRPTSGVPMPGPGMRPDGGLGAAPAAAPPVDLSPDEHKAIEEEVFGGAIREMYLKAKAKIGRNDDLYAAQKAAEHTKSGMIDFSVKINEISTKAGVTDLKYFKSVDDVATSANLAYDAKMKAALDAKVAAAAAAPRAEPKKPGVAAAKPKGPLTAPPMDPTREHIRKAEKPLYQAKGEHLANAKNYCSRVISDYARDHRKTKEAVEKEVVERLKAAVATNSLCKRTGIHAMETVLATDGRFKTQFETGRSEGCLSPEHRNNAEVKGMGFADGKKITPHLRPVYGYIEGAGSNSESYGEIKLVMKDSVKKRTTITCGDSLGMFAEGYACGSPMLNPGIECLDDSIEYLMDAKKGKGMGTEGWRYMEAQMTGGLELAEVQKVVFHASCFGWHGRPARGTKPELGDRYLAVEAKLKAMGIEVEYAPDVS
jgi:hypothetical protein